MKPNRITFPIGLPKPEQSLWAALIFCTVYQSYRYPLQLNTVGMSPLYSDTPPAFQAAKAIVTSVFCLISICYFPKQLFSYSKWFMVAFVVFMSGYPVLKIIGADSGTLN